MATNNNVQNVQFLRNQYPYENREQALAAIQNSVSAITLDGTAVLARYNDDSNTGTGVVTIVGLVYVNGDTKDLTIFDLEGASAEVQELREEIYALLGGGITTANTVTNQLVTLSGDTASTSADTSVEGAKRYAEDLIGTLEYVDTAVTGSYVSEVNQVDGIIAVTREALPTVADEASAKTFVTSVSENLGEISVSKGSITSSGKTIVLADNADGGVNFEANVDGTTIIIDPNTGTMSVASSALVQYEGDNDTVQISAVQDGVRTVSSPLTISATTPSEANVKEQYNLVGASGNTIGATIKIYKDSALLSVALLHADYSDPSDPVLPTYDKTNGWTDIDATAQTQANQALCYAYEDVEGEVIVAAVPVGSFINEQEFASGVTWDVAEGKVRGVVDPTSESFLTVDENGFKISGVSGLVENAIDALDADESGTTEHIVVNVVEEDGVITTVTVEEDNIANTDDLAELSAKTVTEIDSSNASISAVSSSTADGTVKYDIVTDASKIKMSGFTSTDVLSGITEDDSIADAFEKLDTVITNNEEIVSEALNDLNTRVDTVSGDVDTIKSQYISGVSVNGNDVTIANHVAPLAVSASTSAMTSSNNSAIVVDTDANGNITLGLASIDCGYYE